MVKELNKNKNVIDSPLEGNFWRERERERERGRERDKREKER